VTSAPHTLQEINDAIGTLFMLGGIGQFFSASVIIILWKRVSALEKRLEGGK
jgi:hypothetical protein